MNGKSKKTKIKSKKQIGNSRTENFATLNLKQLFQVCFAKNTVLGLNDSNF